MRKEFPERSLLVVTVRDSEDDMVGALEAGADGYITKPFQIRELVARLRAGVRRGRGAVKPTERTLRIGIYELDPPRRLVKERGSTIHLTPTEFDLLSYLMTHAGHPVHHANCCAPCGAPNMAMNANT